MTMAFTLQRVRAASGCVHAGLDGSTRVIYVEEA